MNTYNRVENFFDRNSEKFDWGITLSLIAAIVLGFFLGGCGDEEGGYQRRPHHDSPDPTGGSSGGYDPPYGDDDDGDDGQPDHNCQSVPQMIDLRSYDCYGADQKTHEAELAIGVQFQDQAWPAYYPGYDLNDNGHYGEGLVLENPAANSCGPVKVAIVSFGQPWLQVSEDVEIWEFKKEGLEIAFANIQNYQVQDLSTWWTKDMVQVMQEVFSCQVEGECGYNYSLPPDTLTKLGLDNEASSQVCGLGLYLLRSQ
ncbi:MAG: hypothetical protein ACRCZE_04935 [Candidatus Altimarinota bacterium]